MFKDHRCWMSDGVSTTVQYLIKPVNIQQRKYCWIKMVGKYLEILRIVSPQLNKFWTPDDHRLGHFPANLNRLKSTIEIADFLFGLLLQLAKIFLFSYLAVNKLIIDNTKNIIYLIAKHFGFIKYTLNKID